MNKPDVKVITADHADEIVEELTGEVAEPKPEPKPETKDDDELQGPENPIVFKHPILINGTKRKELRWSEEITSEQFLKADALAHGTRASNSIAEMDSGLHFWIGAMMIVAANPEIDPKDLEQVKGKDVVSLVRIGRFFMLPDVDED